MKNKNSLLFVTSILMIVFGGISIILSIVAILGIASVVYLASQLGVPVDTTMLYLAGILAIVGSVAQLVAGIIGVGIKKNPAKAGKSFTWGVICLVLSVLSIILGLVGGDGFDIVSILMSLVLPVLFTIGAVKAK